MTVIAKAVIDKKYWILTENDVKIGNVEAFNGGYHLKINNQITECKSIKNIEKIIDVKFDSTYLKKTKNNTVHGYSATRSAFNGVWDLNRHLPIFTKTRKSKCWFAAGYYLVTREGKTTVVHCPKLIILQRYDYVGPFYTEEEANECVQ